jgi:hypothetical protein
VSLSGAAWTRLATILMRRLLFGSFLGLLILLAGCQPAGFFGPLRQVATPPGELIRLAAPVTFSQLNEDPAAYHDRVVRTSGSYLKLPPPACNPQRGPLFAWSLADLVPAAGDWLRVDAQGFEDVIWLVPEGTAMTVEGYWRLYEGPLGCGKNAPREAIWYLEVLRIVEPNPLPGMAGAGALPSTPGAGDGDLNIQIVPLATLTPELEATAPPEGTASPTVTVTMTVAPEPQLTPAGTITPTETLGPEVTATVSGTPGPTPTATDTPTPGGPPPTGTPDDGYPPPPPPPPTSTPGGYP